MSKRVFVIGDSISMHYGPYLEKMIEPACQYDRKRGAKKAEADLDTPAGANGGDSSHVLAYLQSEKGKGQLPFDLLVFNCGLHDIKTNPQSGRVQISAEAYENNLNQICDLVLASNIAIIWISTTPVDDERHNTRVKVFSRYNRDVIRYNEIALATMRKHKIPMIDLYAFTATLGPEAYCDHVHFNDETRKLQAAFIAGHILMEQNLNIVGLGDQKS